MQYQIIIYIYLLNILSYIILFNNLLFVNDLFDNMKSIQRIICPYIIVFEVYNKILDTA